MRLPRILPAALLAALACGNEPSVGGGAGPGPRKVEPDTYAVTIRNNCPEPVTLYFGPTTPGPDAQVLELSGSGLEQRKIEKKSRVWLRYRDEWSRRRSIAAAQDGWVIEVLGTCDGVTGRSGPL